MLFCVVSYLQITCKRATSGVLVCVRSVGPLRVFFGLFLRALLYEKTVGMMKPSVTSSSSDDLRFNPKRHKFCRALLRLGRPPSSLMYSSASAQCAVVQRAAVGQARAPVHVSATSTAAAAGVQRASQYISSSPCCFASGSHSSVVMRITQRGPSAALTFR